MKYQYTATDDTPAGKEVQAILNTILRPIQLRKGSPDVQIRVRMSYPDDPNRLVILECLNPDPQANYYGPILKTIAALSFRKGQIWISYLVKFAKVQNPDLFGYHQGEMISLYDPNSLERIQGMIDKALRVLVNGLNKPKRKYEPSTARRGRRPRMGRSVVRFTSV